MKTVFIYITAVFLSNIITGDKHKMRHYIIAALLGIAVTFLTAPMCHGFQVEYSEYAQFDDIAQLDTEQIDHYNMLKQKHEKMAQLCVFTANKMIWFLPDIDEDNLSNMCLTTFAVGLAPATPWSKIIRMFISFSVQYVGHCKDEWNRIQTLLYTAEYHYQMAEFYEDVLNKAEIL